MARCRTLKELQDRHRILYGKEPAPKQVRDCATKTAEEKLTADNKTKAEILQYLKMAQESIECDGSFTAQQYIGTAIVKLSAIC